MVSPLPTSLIAFSILDFERNKNQRHGSEFFSREVGFMRWFPVAYLTNRV